MSDFTSRRSLPKKKATIDSKLLKRNNLPDYGDGLLAKKSHLNYNSGAKSTSQSKTKKPTQVNKLRMTKE